MVFCEFVVCIYLIFGEGSHFKIDISRPETVFNQMGVVSAKAGVVKQIFFTCVLPPS